MTFSLISGSVYFDVEAYGQYNRFVPETRQPDRETKAGGKFRDLIEPPRGKTNNVVSEQVRHKPTCAVAEKS